MLYARDHRIVVEKASLTDNYLHEHASGMPWEMHRKMQVSGDSATYVCYECNIVLLMMWSRGRRHMYICATTCIQCALLLRQNEGLPWCTDSSRIHYYKQGVVLFDYT